MIYELIGLFSIEAEDSVIDKFFPLYVCDADSLAPVIGARCENILIAYHDEWMPKECIRKVAKQVILGEITEERFYNWLVKGV